MKKLLHAVVWKEENLFVAKLLELELASQGKTEEEALRNLKEALDLYLEDEKINNLSFPRIEKITAQTVALN